MKQHGLTSNIEIACTSVETKREQEHIPYNEQLQEDLRRAKKTMQEAKDKEQQASFNTYVRNLEKRIYGKRITPKIKGVKKGGRPASYSPTTKQRKEWEQAKKRIKELKKVCPEHFLEIHLGLSKSTIWNAFSANVSICHKNIVYALKNVTNEQIITAYKNK